VTEAPDRGELLTALTTEHFTLQGARSQTMSESSSRAALYIGAVSSTLVALGFLGQLSLSGHDDGAGVFANASVPADGRSQYFTFGSVVAVINSVVGGSAVAIALGAFLDASLAVAAGVGGVVAIISVIALLRFASRLLEERTGGVAPLFPSR
jgi:hypothetical protein